MHHDTTTTNVKVGLPTASQQTEQTSTNPVAILEQPHKLAKKKEDILKYLA
jgi:hypothetical protein